MCSIIALADWCLLTGIFLHHQDLDYLFLGGMPSSMDEALRKFLPAPGISSSSIMQYRRSATMPAISGKRGRLVSNPCSLDEYFGKWMDGGKSMNDDTLSGLLKTISDPVAIEKKARKADAPPELATIMRNGYSGPDRPKAITLANMLLFFTEERGKLFFDWVFAGTCQKIWDLIRKSHNQRTNSQTSQPGFLVMGIFQDAKSCQRHAEERKTDVDEFLRKHAKGLTQSWQSIQDITRQDNEVSFGVGDELYKDVKSWVGDKELLGVTTRSFRKSGVGSFPMSLPLAEKIYKNWERSTIKNSAVFRINWAPMIKRMEEEANKAAQKTEDEEVGVDEDGRE